jgi:hypothetical protein
MPTIVKLGRVLIRIFADDHNPPHFHIITPDHEALVRISDFSILRGSIDRKSLDRALAWAAEHKEELSNEWTRLNQR